MKDREIIRPCHPIYGKNALQPSFDDCGVKTISVKQLN